MNTRTKWLVASALAIFGLYGADQIYRSQIEEPTNGLNADLDRLAGELQESKNQQAVAKKVNQRLDSYQQRALPYDPQLARSAYQEWLLQLVETHRIQSASVDAAQPRSIETRSRMDRRKRIPVGSTIQYSMRGQATLSQWSDLLSDFRKAGHLHKIRSLSLNPVGAEGQLDANLTIEVFSLVSADRKADLSTWKIEEDHRQSEEQVGAFVRRNLFAKGFSKALYEIRVKAITFDRSGQPQAWFAVDASDAVHPLAVGQQLPVALHDISIVEIQPDRVRVEVNRDPHWVGLGQSVGEVCDSGLQVPSP